MAGKELLPVTVLDASVVLAKSPGGRSFKSDRDACQKIPIKPAPAPKGDLCGVSEWANTVTFHPKHPKLDQNLPFLHHKARRVSRHFYMGVAPGAKSL